MFNIADDYKLTPTLKVAEYEANPSAIIVHDPIMSGSISHMALHGHRATLQDQFLFREIPSESRFRSEYENFVEVLRQAGTKVVFLHELIGAHPSFSQAKHNPNQVYTRDALITLPWSPNSYIAAHMASEIRRPETSTMEALARALNLVPLTKLPDGPVLEGGDVIPWTREGRRSLLIGFGPRTTIEAIDFLSNELIPEHVDEIIGIHLADWRINLDGGLVPVADDVVITHPASIIDGFITDGKSKVLIDVLSMFRDSGVSIIEVTKEESVYQQACNCLCLGLRKVICYDLCQRIIPILRDHEIEVFPIPGEELVKGTGGPRCMSRPIYLGE